MKTRRDFMKLSAIGAAGLLGQGCAMSGKPQEMKKLKEKSVILFQGDSITDNGRNRGNQDRVNNVSALGVGYPLYASARLLAEQPGLGLQIYNRGISGNGVKHLQSRWDRDCLEIKPDILSILIGVNDYWHRARTEMYLATAEKYKEAYDQLLKETTVALPETKLVICGPFILKTGVIDDQWYPHFAGYQQAAKELADKYNAIWIDYQAMFDQACEKAPANYWLYDGVHSSLAGAKLMADYWLEAVL